MRDVASTPLTISVNVSLPLKFNKKPSGFAFVGYATADVAKKAAEELNDKRKLSLLGQDTSTDRLAFADRTAHVQLARSKEETEERRKATQERRAAEKATKALERKQKTLDEGGVIGEGEGEGDAKPSRRRGDRVSTKSQLSHRARLMLGSDDVDLERAMRRPERVPPTVRSLVRVRQSLSESLGLESPRRPRRRGSMVPRERLRRSLRVRERPSQRRLGSPDSPRWP